MRKVLLIWAVLIAGIAISTFSATVPRDAAMLTFYEGDVKIRLNDETDWGEPIQDIILQEGDAIRTGPAGKARIVLEDASSITIGPMSIFTINQVAFNPETGTKSADFNLEEGMARARVSKLITADSSFTISTPSAVAGVRGTDFVVEVEPASNKSVVTVLEGAVDVQSRISAARERVRVLRDQTTDVAPGGDPSSPKQADPSRLRNLREKLAKRGEMGEKTGGELAENQAAALVAFSASGMEGRDMDGVKQMVMNGEIQPEQAKGIVYLAAMGVPRNEIMDTLQVIKDKDIPPAEMERLINDVRANAGGDVQQVLAEFRDEAEGRPDRSAQDGNRAGAPATAGQPNEDVALHPRPEDMANSAGPAAGPQGADISDPREQEERFRRKLVEMGIEPELIDNLLQAVRDKKMDMFEAEWAARNIMRGVNPELIRRTFVAFHELKVPVDVRRLVLKALNIGLTREKLVLIMDRLRKGETDIDTIRRNLSAYIEERVSSTDTEELKPDTSLTEVSAENDIPTDVTNTGSAADSSADSNDAASGILDSLSDSSIDLSDSNVNSDVSNDVTSSPSSANETDDTASDADSSNSGDSAATQPDDNTTSSDDGTTTNDDGTSGATNTSGKETAENEAAEANADADDAAKDKAEAAKDKAETSKESTEESKEESSGNVPDLSKLKPKFRK